MKGAFALTVRGSLHALAVLALAGAVAALLAIECAGSAWPVCLVSPFYPQLGLLGLAGVVLHAATARSRRGRAYGAGIVLGAAIPAWVLAVELWGCGRRVPTLPAAHATDGQGFTVLVCNVYSDNREHAAVLRLIDAADADVVLLLEVTTPWLEAVARIEGRYPHHRARADDQGNFGIGVWSKHAFSRGGIVFVPDPVRGGRHVPQVDVDLAVAGSGGASLVRFLGVHPLPPLGPARVAERDDLLEWVALECQRAPDLPTIVAGDLNASRWCAIALRLARLAGLRDATASLHRSWPSSLRRLPMATRIDHVWAGRGWAVESASRGPDIGSDHFPVLARLRWEPER